MQATYDADEPFSTGSAPPDFAIRRVMRSRRRSSPLSVPLDDVLTALILGFSSGLANCKSKRFSKKYLARGKD
jgi:hypothetical protein